MPGTMRTLGVVGRLFPAILSGEKTSTIRWREPPISPGPLKLVHDDDPAQAVVVQVRRSAEMPLSEAASFVGGSDEWPDDVILRGMREHHPDIALSDLVQVVECDPPSLGRAADERS